MAERIKTLARVDPLRANAMARALTFLEECFAWTFVVGPPPDE